MPGENFRREIRMPTQLRVVLVRGRNMLELQASDVSFKGLFVRTTEPLAPYALIRLRVSLPKREIDVHAMVVHASEKGVGVEFFGLAGHDRNAWDDYVGALLRARRVPVKAVDDVPSSSAS